MVSVDLNDSVNVISRLGIVSVRSAVDASASPGTYKDGSEKLEFPRVSLAEFKLLGTEKVGLTTVLDVSVGVGLQVKSRHGSAVDEKDLSADDANVGLAQNKLLEVESDALDAVIMGVHESADHVGANV